MSNETIYLDSDNDFTACYRAGLLLTQLYNAWCNIELTISMYDKMQVVHNLSQVTTQLCSEAAYVYMNMDWSTEYQELVEQMKTMKILTYDDEYSAMGYWLMMQCIIVMPWEGEA